MQCTRLLVDAAVESSASVASIDMAATGMSHAPPFAAQFAIRSPEACFVCFMSLALYVEFQNLPSTIMIRQELAKPVNLAASPIRTLSPVEPKEVFRTCS